MRRRSDEHGHSSWSGISGDGRYVVFGSLSDTPSDADGIQDVFLRDVLGGPPPSNPEPPRIQRPCRS